LIFLLDEAKNASSSVLSGLSLYSKYAAKVIISKDSKKGKKVRKADQLVI